MTARILLGVVAKEPVYAPELREPTKITDSMVCARCDGEMVITYDALRNPRRRCPTCDGVAAPRPVHPDQVLVPVTLARLTADALPPIEPGQLRCQRCARGVEGKVRFHPECLAAISLEKKRRRCSCGTLFVRRAKSPATECDACIAKRKAKKPRLCTGCNRLNSTVRGARVVASCSECRPVPVLRPRRPAKAKPPAERPCGHAYPKRRGRRRRECETSLALAASPSPLEAVA